MPYLAWRGEDVRLVDCTASAPVDIVPADLKPNSEGFGYNDGSLDRENLQLYDYTTQQPNGTLHGAGTGYHSGRRPGVVFFDYANGRICARQTWNSAKPGIAILKLTVDYDGAILDQHDFMVGWMAIGSATITNPSARHRASRAHCSSGNSVNVQVTGTIPTDQEFQNDYGLLLRHADDAERLGDVGERHGQHEHGSQR